MIVARQETWKEHPSAHLSLGARDLRYASDLVSAIAVEEVYVGIDEAGVGKPEKAAMHTGCE